MRLRACMGSLLFLVTGCAGLPERLKIEVDGRTIEVRQQGFGAYFLEGRWSSSSDCLSAAELLPREAVKIRSIAPDEIEIEGEGGVPTRLFRCSR